MTPRERVLAALDLIEPDRVPYSWGFGVGPRLLHQLDQRLAPHGLDWRGLKARTNEILRDAWAPPVAPAGESIWGYTRKPQTNAVGGVYQEFDHQPLATAESVADIEAHPWPDPTAYDFKQVAPRIRAADPDRQRVISGSGANPLEQLQWLMGLEKSLLEMVARPELIHAALRRITDFFREHIRLTLEAAEGLIDLWFCADDLGGQHGPLISPRLYRELVQPYHAELFALLRSYGVKVLYHTDGSVHDLLDDLLDAGIDCLEAVQVECRRMEPERLKAGWGDRLAFHGGVSVQQVLPRATPAEVRAHVRHLKRVFGAGGGYICAPSHVIQDGTPPENVVAMLEEALEQPLAEICA